MAVRKSYRLITNGYIQPGAGYFEGPAVAIDPHVDCLNVFLTVDQIIGTPGDGFTPILETSPNGTNWNSVLTRAIIDTAGSYYIAPTDFYVKPDSYIRLYLLVSGIIEVPTINAWARVGSLTSRGRYGR